MNDVENFKLLNKVVRIILKIPRHLPAIIVPVKRLLFEL